MRGLFSKGEVRTEGEQPADRVSVDKDDVSAKSIAIYIIEIGFIIYFVFCS